jgi:hypothetical protein
MLSIPSRLRTECIKEMAEELDLTEPYRAIYPNKIEYTYIPSALNNMNRYRIDFFLSSSELLEKVTYCEIPHSLSTTLFDHKLIFLSLGKCKKPVRPVIKDMVLKDKDLQFHVQAGIIETYLHHSAVTPGFSEGEKQRLLRVIGNIMRNLQAIKELELNMATNGRNEREEILLAGYRGEVRLLFDDMPELTFFENLDKTCGDEIFFETLANSIRNNTLSHQSTIFTVKNARKQRLMNLISDLKRQFNENSNEILNLERELSVIEENERKQELEHYRTFSILNAERITPYFMSLVKNTKQEQTTNDIVDDASNIFISEEERATYIGNYFKNLHKANDNNNQCTLTKLEDFLGVTKDNIEVINSKLSDVERAELETALTVPELDEAIDQCNLKSAPGADGFSNKFIKHFWEYVRIPLYKYAVACFDSGSLTDNFRSANIRLIPKKGKEPGSIKNWRPISLLNCFYKCISRAIANRLKKYMDKLCPRAQKGYSNTKYGQEVLMGVIETIEKCNFLKRKGVV